MFVKSSRLWILPLILCLGCPSTNGPGPTNRPPPQDPPIEPGAPQADEAAEGVWEDFQALRPSLDGSRAAALRLAAFLLDPARPEAEAIPLVDACMLAAEPQTVRLGNTTHTLQLPEWSAEAVNVNFAVQQFLRGSATRYLASLLVSPDVPQLVVYISERGAEARAAMQLALLEYLTDFEAGWPDDRATALLAGRDSLGPAQAAQLEEIVGEALESSREFCLDRVVGLLAAGDTESAEARIGRLTTEVPGGFAPGWALLAAQRVDQDLDAAEALLQKALDLDPSSPACIIARAEVEVARGHVDAAETMLQAALEKQPDSFVLLQWQGDLCTYQEKPEEALAILLRAAQLAHKEVQITAVVGRIAQIAIQLGEWKLAELAQTRYLESEESFFHRFYRAVSRSNQGRFTLAMEDVGRLMANEAWNAEHGEQFGQLRENVLTNFSESHGPVPALSWALRVSPGDEQLEARLAAAVQELLRTGEEVVVPASGSPRRAPEVEPWQGALTLEEQRYMASRSLSESRYRLEKARWAACHKAMAGARGAEVVEPPLGSGDARLLRLRDRVETAARIVRGRFWNNAGWQEMIDECTGLLQRYPAPRAYLVRALAHLARFDYPQALRDASLAMGMEALERSDDPGRDLMPDARDLARLCLHLEEGGATGAELTLLGALNAVQGELWLDAWIGFTDARRPYADDAELPFTLAECYALTTHHHRAQYTRALVDMGRAALASGDMDFAWTMRNNLLILDPTVEGYAFVAELGKAKGDEEEWEIAYENALFDDPFFAPSHLALGNLYRDRGDPQRALLHFNAGCQGAGGTDYLYGSADQVGEVAKLDGQSGFEASLSGDAARCLALRAELEKELPDPLGFYARGFDDRFPTTKKFDLGLMIACRTRMLGLASSLDIDLLTSRTLCFQWLGDRDRHSRDCELVRRLAPELEVWYHNHQATMAFWLYDYPAALPHFERLHVLDPENKGTWEESGLCSSILGDAEATIRKYLRAVELGSLDWSLYIELTELLADAGRFEEAGDIATRAAYLPIAKRESQLQEEALLRAREYKARAREAAVGR